MKFCDLILDFTVLEEGPQDYEVLKPASMPPGPAYNFLCVAHSLCKVLDHVAQIRAAQLARTAGVGYSQNIQKKGGEVLRKHGDLKLKLHAQEVCQREELGIEINNERNNVSTDISSLGQDVYNITPKEMYKVPSSSIPSLDAYASPDTPPLTLSSPTSTTTGPVSSSTPTLQGLEVPQSAMHVADSATITSIPGVEPSVISGQEPQPIVELIPPETPTAAPQPIRVLQSSKVPSSRIGRLFHYGGLAASLSFGAATELLRRSTQAVEDANRNNSLMMSEGNVKRLVAKLTRMRGAALKLGQFLSIQDSHVLPPEVEEIFRRVQDSAHYMPDWQMEQVMKSSLGPDWATKFVSFDRVPFAAASIGQVHSAVLAAGASPTGRVESVAVKVQFPNIKESIQSDLGYVKLLLTAGRILPRGLFLDRTLQVMAAELADECNYTREASFLRRFGTSSFLGNDPRFRVPWVWDGSTEHVLVMERVEGTSVGGSVIEGLTQDERDMIAERIIDLCLQELFVFRMMQTDPNWTNFLWNGRTKQVELVDFGATREYSKEFMDSWLRLLQAAASDDRQQCIDWSCKVGYLTGQEDEIMLDAHVRSMCLLATPFKQTTEQPFAFGPGSGWADITAEIRAQIPVMLQHRLTPPPRETYSLNRKLSGAFLLAGRLNAKVDCKTLWDKVVSSYQFEVADR